MTDEPEDDGYRPYQPKNANQQRRAQKDARVEDVAKAFLAEHRLVQTASGQFYRYDDRCWQRYLPDSFKADLRLFLGLGVGSDQFNTTSAAVAALAHDQGLSFAYGGDEEVACFNGMLNVVTGELRPHHWADWLENTLPVVWRPDIVPAQASPLWHKALEVWFGDDVTAFDALQEFFGYCCLGHARFKKALLALGEPDSGKSVALKVLGALISGSTNGGNGAMCSLDPHLMDDPVALAVLKGKRLNVVTELPENKAIAASGFKKLISTEEPIYVSEKYERSETYVSRAKHAFAANDLPTVTERIKPVLTRLLILPFPHAIPKEEQIQHLPERIAETELEGVLAWAMVGARRLVESGGSFTQPREAARLLGEIEENSNPMPAFIDEHYIPSPGARLPLSEMLTAFNRWHGGRSWTIAYFGRKVREAGFVVEKQRPPSRVGRPSRPVACLMDWRVPDAAAPAGASWSPDDDEPPPHVGEGPSPDAYEAPS